MKTLPGSRFTLLFAALVLVMVTTRFKHFGDVLHLPDASMAIFFVGGLFLRKHWAFAVFILLAVGLDEVSIHYGGLCVPSTGLCGALVRRSPVLVTLACGRVATGRGMVRRLALGSAFLCRFQWFVLLVGRSLREPPYGRIPGAPGAVGAAVRSHHHGLRHGSVGRLRCG